LRPGLKTVEAADENQALVARTAGVGRVCAPDVIERFIEAGAVEVAHLFRAAGGGDLAIAARDAGVDAAKHEGGVAIGGFLHDGAADWCGQNAGKQSGPADASEVHKSPRSVIFDYRY